MKTSVIKIDPINTDFSAIDKAISVLKADRLIAFPTDTVYGIGANAFSKSAVEKIFKAKGRDLKKPLQVLIADKNDLDFITEEKSVTLIRLIERFMPGALTIVIPAKKDFPRWATCGLDTVGVRMPANKFAIELIKAFGMPISATSANISGMPDPKDANQVLKYLDGKIDLVVDGGPTFDNVPSTVLDISTNPPKILRLGKITPAELGEILNL